MFTSLTACVLSLGFLSTVPGWALQNATPWSAERSVQNLVYGSSSFNDVTMSLGRPPDEIVRSEQMYPPIVNFYYFDENKSGAATVFVFENGLLVGMQYKSSDNQYVDISYFLQNNGDRQLNFPYTAGYQGYFPFFPLYGMRGNNF
jgi:hypothetical protein